MGTRSTPTFLRLACAATLALAASPLVGCGDDDPAQTSDATTAIDSGPDVTTDSGPDAATDATPDAGPDAGPDTVADTTPDAGGPNPAHIALVEGVTETERWSLAGLSGPVHVVRTESNIPHVYASNRLDLGRVLGFTVARDRYFILDLQRRLGLGSISELLGDAGLESDIESRQDGITEVAGRLNDHLSADLAAYLDAVAGGINAYIDAVKAGELPPPSELELATGLLGADSPAELMQPWGRKDLAAMVAVVMYETTFETGDVGRADTAVRAQGLFVGFPDEQLRKDGFWQDVWNDASGIFEAPSVPGWGTWEGDKAIAGADAAPTSHGARSNAGRFAPVYQKMLDELSQELTDREHQLGRNDVEGFGSNAWAVAGSASTDGASLTAGDGHLQLSVPALFFQVGLNTNAFGGGNLHQTGLLMTGLPIMAVGTNGKVAWSQVNPVTDTTDWYREEIQLGADGVPKASFFQGEWRPLIAVEETFEVADVPALGSVGRTEKWTRWTTFDGRHIARIEGKEVAADYMAEAGETIANFRGRLIVPGDEDDDQVVTAISFDYAAFDATGYIRALDGFGFSEDVWEYREWTRGLVGSALFSAVGDSQGNILFSSYQAIPCRGYLERDDDGQWAPGADPTLLLDGTRYGGFTLPTDADGRVDEGPGKDDPYKCVIPFDVLPQAVNPPSGFVFTANNDPGSILADKTFQDDPHYIGGPWSSVRAHTIRRRLAAAVVEDNASEDEMASIQADHASRLGEVFAPHLLAAIQAARTAGDAVYTEDSAAFDAVEERLEGWAQRGFLAKSGVETFYTSPAADDVNDSIATMIFNAWLPRTLSAVFGDEKMVYRFNGTRTQLRVLRHMLASRGADNPLGLGSHNPATSESVFFDNADTVDVETSDALLLEALVDALAFLRSEPSGKAQGGFGTEDMTEWRWGLRHQTRFESLLAGFLGDDPTFALLLEPFSITTDVLHLAESLPSGDPRRQLLWFPRPGDNYGVDAANPGFSGTHFTHGSGPVMRMVIALKDGEVRGRNVIPGGQSALVDSDFFADQAALWLKNEAHPVRFHVEDVVAGATGREIFTPK